MFFRTLTLLLLVTLVGCASINLVATQAPELRLEEIHPLGATRVEFDASGKRIATAGHLGGIYIWQLPAGKLLASLKYHEKKVRALIWVDSNTLISSAEDGNILVWDIEHRKVVKNISGTIATSLVYAKQHKMLYSGHEDGRLQQWTYPDMKELKAVSLKAPVLSVALSPSEKQLAVSTDNSQVHLYDSELNHYKSLETRDKNAQELRYSPDGKQLAAGTWFDLYFWDLKSGKLTVKKTEHIGAIISVDYTPDGKRLVSLGRHTDANLRVISMENGALLRRLRAHNLCGYLVRVSPDGRYVASASEDESVRIYDISKPYQPTWGE